MPEYTLTLNSDQAHEVLKAVELLMRLKINQPGEITRSLLDSMYKRIGIDEYCRRRSLSDPYLKLAFDALLPSGEDIRKDDEWYRLYNLYQSLRYAIHEAEHPNSIGVDSDPPMQFTSEPLPGCTWKR